MELADVDASIQADEIDEIVAVGGGCSVSD
jgi:glycerol dehydrogenase-like iron-containing ADH family enzyme